MVLASKFAVGPNVDSTLGPTEGVGNNLREAGVGLTAPAFVEARKPRLACRNINFSNHFHIFLRSFN